ncbi:hypothetical protein ACWGI8_40565 [Streptomyces sp. NPDC054841]
MGNWLTVDTQGIRAGEAEHGGLDTVPARGQQFAGLGDRGRDRARADFQHLGQYEL